MFVCTSNAARSIQTEAILNQDNGGKVKALSAGSYDVAP
jgi:protein-tyrosine-phosphatase